MRPLDTLAAYLYLIDPPADSPQAPIPPSSIIMMGDSAGANLIVALLVTMRETGVPLPAAANLVSAWCDLTHSMPSINEWGGGDHIINVGYVRPCGTVDPRFHFKPSLVWPLLPGDG
jgi:acetyl esterase/lipase